MKQFTQQCIRSTVGLVLCVLLVPVSMAQDDPPHRVATPADKVGWGHENTSSARDYYASLKKEAGAAFYINKQECKQMKHKSARANCEKEAREVYKQDLIDAKQKADEMRS